MPLSYRQLTRLREGRKCLDLPRPRRVSEAVKFDCAVIVGVLAVLAFALWLRLPIMQDAVLLVLSAVAGVAGAWAVWSSVRWLRGWTRATAESADTLEGDQ